MMGKIWSDGSYYGIRTKRYFNYLDTMLRRLFKEAMAQGTSVSPEVLEQILRLTARQNHLVYTITKLNETMDLNQRLMDMEKLLQAIPPELLSKSSYVDGWRAR